MGIHSEPYRFRDWPARHYPDDAVVDPRDVTRALLTVCRRRLVEVHENQAVTSVEMTGRGVRTVRGSFEGDGVVIAAGAWSSDLLPGLPRTFPVRGHLIGFALTPGLLDTILRRNNTYLVQRRSGFLIAGSSSEEVGFDRTVDTAVVADIHNRAGQLLPVLSSVLPTEQWIGFRPGIDAAQPAIGRLPGRAIWTAFGHYRNGILMAPETARIIADSVMER